MTQQPTNVSATRWASVASLIAGIASLLLMIIFFATPAGAALVIASMILGAIGVVLGIVAVKTRQPRGLAIAGIVTGAVGFLLGLAIYLFALLFVGAFSV